MRVLMIAPQPFFQPRGTPFSVLHRLKALSKFGYKIDLLTYHLGEDVEVEGVTIHRIAKVPFIKKIAIGPSKPKIILDLLLLFKTRALLKAGNYDLIHSHEEAGFWCAWFANKYRITHLYDMHSSLPQQLENFKFTKSGIIKKIFDGLENYTIKSAKAVITICPELHDYVEKLFPDKHNVLIENVADNSLVFNTEVDSQAIKKKVKLNGEVTVLYAGTFETYQGIDLLIDSSVKVIKDTPKVRFVMVGGKPEQIEAYKEKTKRLNMESHFLFTGSVVPEEVPAYIENSDILVSPRLEGNNTPLKIYSYLRSGKPIVATNHLTHTQVLNKDVSILTDCTPESFGDGLLSILKNKNLGKKISENAAKLAEDKYSYDVYLNKTKELYKFIESEVK